MYKVITEGLDSYGHHFKKGDVVQKDKELYEGVFLYKRISDNTVQYLDDFDVEKIQGELNE